KDLGKNFGSDSPVLLQFLDVQRKERFFHQCPAYLGPSEPVWIGITPRSRLKILALLVLALGILQPARRALGVRERGEEQCGDRYLFHWTEGSPFCCADSNIWRNCSCSSSLNDTTSSKSDFSTPLSTSSMVGSTTVGAVAIGAGGAGVW